MKQPSFLELLIGVLVASLVIVISTGLVAVPWL